MSLSPSFAPSFAPSLLPSTTPPDFTCQALSNNNDFSHLCYNLDAPGFGMDAGLANLTSTKGASFVPLFGCNIAEDTLTNDEPNRDECSLCIIQASRPNQTTEYCSSCTLMSGSTDLVYDCRNLEWLFPTLSERGDNNETDLCLARNVDGDCGDFVHWDCISQNLGYACFQANRAVSEVQNPAFSQGSVPPTSQITLFCANDISGQTVWECQQPKCNLFSAETRAACTSCTVTTETTDQSSTRAPFVYDCAEAFPNMSCPILDSNGTCFNRSSIYTTGNATEIIGIASLTKDGGDNNNNDDKWTWTLKRVPPTAFNVLSDLFAYFTRLVLGIALTSLYPLWMIWQVKHMGKPVPIQALGSVPGDCFSATSMLRALRWSLPAIILVTLLIFADFFHSVADAGLDFVEVRQQGPLQSILYMSPNTTRRNPSRPIQTTGDPQHARTAVLRVAAENGQITLSRQQTALIDAYVAAIGLVARGASPLAQYAPSPRRDYKDFGTMEGFDTFFMPDNSPIAALDWEIPLECDSMDMAEIDQIIVGFPLFDEPVESTALIPNCTFSFLRSSGINGGSLGRAEILEQSGFVGIAPGINAVNDGREILLRKGNETFQIFTATPEQKQLARDRQDWRTGRAFDGVDGLIIGNTTIDLGHVVLARGAEAAGSNQYYGLFAEIQSECPLRPSGQPTNAGTHCIAAIQLLCEEFEEDLAGRYHPLYAPSTQSSECELSSISLAWGRNFVVDPELVSVVAGLYGIVRPSVFDRSILSFNRHVVLAALLALGTVEERPSIESVVRPQVNVLYLLFMIFPIVLTVGLFITAKAYLEKQSTIPQTPWELMVFAKDEDNIPKRPNKASPFPEPPNDLVFGFVDAGDVEHDSVAAFGITQISQTVRRESLSGSLGEDKNEEIMEGQGSGAMEESVLSDCQLAQDEAPIDAKDGA